MIIKNQYSKCMIVAGNKCYTVYSQESYDLVINFLFENQIGFTEPIFVN